MTAKPQPEGGPKTLASDPPPPPARKKLGDVLVEAGAITTDDLRIALERQAARTGEYLRLGEVIVQEGFASEFAMARALAQQLGLPYIDLATVVADPDLLQLIPQGLAMKHDLVPLRRNPDGSVLLAMADPTNVVAADDVRAASGVGRVTIGVATIAGVKDALQRLYGMDLVANDIVSRLGDAADVEVFAQLSDEANEDLTSLAQSAQSAPIVKLVNGILADAVNMRATDIHVEPQPTELRVRYRVDGLLRDVMTLPKHIQALFISRIKIMAGMDIADRRRPQDGRTTLVIGNRDVDTRVSSLPTLSGEKIVLRLLNKIETSMSLDSIGLEPEQLQILRRAIASPQGLVIFSGPTGSGKTTTMYSALRELQTVESNIVTLEDPIEYQLAGLNQVAINEKANLSFASGLRSILRQDPDVIMVGEIRDLDTASMVVQSSLTGHLVLSSLHTTDAISSITRMIDLGVEPFRLAPAVSLLISQRLVRVICEHCREPAEITPRVLDLLGISASAVEGIKLPRGAGCEACHFTGYHGRTGLYELVPVTHEFREQLTAQMSQIASVIKPKISLRDHGLMKVKAGITTLDEVLRVTHLDQEELTRCPSCKHVVDPSFVVCPYCQSALRTDTCHRCGRPVEEDWEVCAFCRAPLTAPELESNGRQRLLFVDDDASLRMLVETMFKDTYDVILAKTGHEALRKATLEKPDVMLLDLHLPDISGTEVAERLRKSADTSLIPLIMLTGDDTREMESLRAGVDDFVTKPFDETLLQLRVESVLRRSGGHG
jgi:type IV pilus assembly protein PilB